MKKKKILIVEDEGIVALDLRNTLEKLGYDVPAVAVSGKEALDKAEKFTPDLALMDIVLQGKMDGIETTSLIRSRFNFPVVYLTAYVDEDILERAKITEPFGYMVKPFSQSTLHSTIEMALLKYKIENEREKLIRKLQNTLDKVEILQGLLPICANCKKIRDQKGSWHNIEIYMEKHFGMEFTHSICKPCFNNLYPGFCYEGKV